MTFDLQQLAGDDFCYLTTTGRISGQPHTIEIWFALKEQTLYMLSDGGGADWVKNIHRQSAVQVKIREHTITGQGRVVQDAQEDMLARQLVANKYIPRSTDDLQDWSHTAVPVAVDLVLSNDNQQTYQR